jgi:3',5'-cyclic AMP phosphodiesterase CpdA
VLAAAPRDTNGFVQGWRDTPVDRLLFLDTLDETSHHGQLCDRRLTWLRQTLAETPADRPIYLFMHQPPFAVGVHMMDRIALADAAALITVIKPNRARIRHLFFGHVHRPIAGSCSASPSRPCAAPTIRFASIFRRGRRTWRRMSPPPTRSC